MVAGHLGAPKSIEAAKCGLFPTRPAQGGIRPPPRLGAGTESRQASLDCFWARRALGQGDHGPREVAYEAIGVSCGG